MAKKKKQPNQTAPPPRFIEIVNWKKAQPRMKGKDNAWMKLYTSLLDNDAYARLDDPARVLLSSLWLYASRSGQHVLPADPKWIWQKLPFLHTKPDLQPLIDAADVYGNPDPFVRYCDTPRPKTRRANKAAQPDETRRANTAAQPDEKKHREERQTLDIADVTSVRNEEKKSSKKKTRVEENRVEENRLEENRLEENRLEETRLEKSRGEPAGDGRVEEKEKKRRVTTARKKRPDQSQTHSTTDQSTTEPVDPPKPDQGQEQAAFVAQPAPGSVSHSQARRRHNRPSPSPVHDYNRHDLALGRRIHIALGLTTNPDSGDGYSEVTSFASVWHKIMEQLARAPPETRDQLGVRAIHEARNIAKSKTARNKASIWNSIIRKIAASEKWSTT